MEQARYEQAEVALFSRQILDIAAAPLADRKEARTEWGTVMREQPDTVAERIDWILAGHYGQGAYIMARRVAGNKRLNRAACLAHMVAALEWACPAPAASAEYNTLNQAEREAIDSAIAGIISAWEQEQEQTA